MEYQKSPRRIWECKEAETKFQPEAHFQCSALISSSFLELTSDLKDQYCLKTSQTKQTRQTRETRSMKFLTNTSFLIIKNSKLGEFPLKVIFPECWENKPEVSEAYLDINGVKNPAHKGGALKPKPLKPRTEIPKQVRDDKKRRP